MTLKNIFKKERNIIIGALHFAPLPGYKECPGIKVILENALKDLRAFEEGGVDGVIIENNYDIPHTEKVSKETVAAMTYLGEKLKEKTRLPIGVSVLWNDHEASISIAKTIGGKFVRIPVFVDTAKTAYGIMEGKWKEVTAYQEKIKAKNVALFTDIHVKHAEIISKMSIVESAHMAIQKGSDALIITGKWTGDAPDLEELKKVKQTVKKFPILIGSGVDKKNIQELLRHANGVIVSTSLKKGGVKTGEINIKAWQQRIMKTKVARLTKYQRTSTLIQGMKSVR